MNAFSNFALVSADGTVEELKGGEADRDFDPEFPDRFSLVRLLDLDWPCLAVDLPLLGGLLEDGAI